MLIVGLSATAMLQRRSGVFVAKMQRSGQIFWSSVSEDLLLVRMKKFIDHLKIIRSPSSGRHACGINSFLTISELEQFSQRKFRKWSN